MSVLVVLVVLLLTGVAGARAPEAKQVSRPNVPKQKAAPQGGAKGTPKATHQAQGPTNIVLMLRNLFGGNRFAPATNGPIRGALPKGHDSVQLHKSSQRTSQENLQPPAQNQAGSQREQRSLANESRQGEAKLQAPTRRAGSQHKQVQAQIARLEAADQAGLIEEPPATGVDPQFSERELQIAQDDIVALPVDPVSFERYVQIYKMAAKRYGFAKDWYVLEAIGKLESNHGQNMGPSSAGAMGPMQFLPSTWEEFGVDGNGDGVANIMDPEDAIPAAAAYLQFGGAPEDWYRALYTYNHSGQYVRKVLSVADGYRRSDKDH